MGKRSVVVISSSEEEEGEWRDGVGGRSRSSKSRSRTVSAECKRNKCPTKRRASSARLSSKRSSRMEDVGFENLSEDFYECLHGPGLHVVPGYGKMEAKELWVDKHRPHSLEELAVHKKKVEEIRKWFEDRMALPKDAFHSNVLLITGQAGVGKSAAIHVVASQLGVELCEWRTPTPTLWQEHIHNSDLGIQYMSKLDEFETFVEQIRKYPMLQQTSRVGPRKPVVLLIDDIPLVNGRVAYGKLSRSLHLLAHSAQVPTIILMTQYANGEAGDNTTRYLEEIEASLERAGACKVSFNPLTVNSIKKALLRICREENYNYHEEWIDMISRASGGDIRHAITSLQYFCLGPTKSVSLPPSTCNFKGNPDSSSLSNILPDDESDGSFTLSFGRDETLSLFHALGKFLHNKRLEEDVSEPKSFLLHERFVRSPLKMDAPEKILCQAHGQARPIADFLHENVLDFLSNEAISDAWIVDSYLSDADCLLASSLRPSWSRLVGGIHEPEHISQSVAASVAVRGVLFGNSQPSSSRWHSVRKPKLWQVEQSSCLNKKQMVMERYELHNSFRSCSIADIATEYRPLMNWLGSRALDVHSYAESSLGCEMEVDNSDWLNGNNLKGHSFQEENEDDEIEDW